MSDRIWFVYLLLCRGDRIYTGVTPDIEKRVCAHRVGKGARFTRINPPERLLAIKACAGKIEAMQLEAQIKRVPRAAKLKQAKDWLVDYALDDRARSLFQD